MSLAHDINAALIAAMKLRRLRRATLAQRLDVSRAQVTQILRDREHNWELATLERWCAAIGCTLEVVIQDPLNDEPSVIVLRGRCLALFST